MRVPRTALVAKTCGHPMFDCPFAPHRIQFSGSPYTVPPGAKRTDNHTMRSVPIGLPNICLNVSSLQPSRDLHRNRDGCIRLQSLVHTTSLHPNYGPARFIAPMCSLLNNSDAGYTRIRHDSARVTRTSFNSYNVGRSEC